MRYLICIVILLCACTAQGATPESSPELTHEVTPEITDTLTPTIDPSDTLEPTFTPSSTITPSETSTPTLTPSFTPTDDPTPTIETITNETQLNAFLARYGVREGIITQPITITHKAPLIMPNMTLRCSQQGSLSNAPNYIGRVFEVIMTADVHIDDCTFYRQVNTTLSCCADVILIYNSARVTIENSVIVYGIDETLDIQASTDIVIKDSIVAYPLNCSTHTKGCHGYDILITNSTVMFTGNIIASAKARMPQLQLSNVTITDNVIYNWDGSAIAAVDDSRLTVTENIGKAGLDTDAISYLIVTPNRADYTKWPIICEQSNLLIGGYRIRRPADRDSYLSNCANTTMPTMNDFNRIINNAGNLHPLSSVIRDCVRLTQCAIRDVPF